MAFFGSNLLTNPALRQLPGGLGNVAAVAQTVAKIPAYIKSQVPSNPTNIGPLRSGGGGGGSAPVYAPKLDIAAVNAQARQAAENAVNPYYTKVLSEFLQQQAAARARREAQTKTNIEDIEAGLKEATEGNLLARARTTEDVNKNITDVNVNADEFQTDSGEQFTDERLQQAREISAAGLTGGLGSQKAQKAVETRNKIETRQVRKFEEQKVAQQLFKTRTFQDLEKSDELNLSKSEKGKKQAKFDLDSYIEASNFDEQNKRNELEARRLEAIQTNQGAQSKLLFNNYLANIRDPRQLAAAMSTYGGIF